MKPERILFESEMIASGGREGRVASPDDTLALELSLPKSMGGPGGNGTNPEQLFAAGYAACFLGASSSLLETERFRQPVTYR